ncbi:hypothetical protein DF050_04065 [Burkholderia cepacia]|nr:hypothetical protein DF050_04065 [Burkholderia cepacia]
MARAAVPSTGGESAKPLSLISSLLRMCVVGPFEPLCKAAQQVTNFSPQRPWLDRSIRPIVFEGFGFGKSLREHLACFSRFSD